MVDDMIVIEATGGSSRKKIGGTLADYDASASALGFLHQIRWSLLELLRYAKRDQTVRMSLEIFDDVAIENEDGMPLKAIQLKQHATPANLSNASVDLWKTLRVWLDTPALKNPSGPLLYLVTTGGVGPNSAASFLEIDGRVPEMACEILDETARSSEAEATEAARALWLDADASDRLALLKRVRIIAGAAAIGEVDDLVAAEFAVLVRPEHMTLFLERLWGWWDSVCIKILHRGDGAVVFVQASQLVARTQDLRDEFTKGILPIDLSLAEVDETDIESHYSKIFVEQLRFINIHSHNLKLSIVNYQRAYNQTAKWLKDGDLVEEDLSAYEREIVSEWQVHFEDMCDRLTDTGTTVTAAEQLRAGRELFQLLRDSNETLIRKNFTDSFLANGTRHIMADRGALGWHPEFAKRLKELVLPESRPAA
ncbi:ABC-three component system protein [Cryobacterium sp. Y50]|uniref:ABC-three component system protein n=1 Tax=Cryobacterium sp. Y50 TaxID=2048286 RepID=UPI0011B07696|nr:ABC-three component system protein [Cryobacterium sp. Y50]